MSSVFISKRSFGETPHDYITRQRVNRAQTIMLNSREPLVNIALDCGMADQSHFGRVFRRVIGVTPAAWRRQSVLDLNAPARELNWSLLASASSITLRQGGESLGYAAALRV